MTDITPKEAIASLNHLYGMVAPDIQRSLDVAIKALERPQGDLISREAFRKHYCKINCGERQCVDHADRCNFIDELMQFKTEPERPKGDCISDTNKWDKTSSEQEESEQPNDETVNNVCDFNDGIADPTYINGIVDCSDFGIYPWGNS